MFLCCAQEEGGDAIAEIGVPAVPAGEAVKRPSKTLAPAPEHGTFMVDVPAKDFDSLGVKLDKIPQGSGHMIAEVESSGAIAAFNKETPIQCLKPFDVIMAVDGVKGFDEIGAKLDKKLGDTVVLQISRPVKAKLTLKKTGPLGIKMDYKDSGLGAVISEVNSTGVLAQWNVENPGQRVGVSDRIVEFDGKQCKGKELLDMIKEASTLPLTVLKY